jgi:hypothetical protein
MLKVMRKKNKEELVYKLIFSDEEDFIITTSDYIEDIYKYDRFIDDIKSILKKSKVQILKEKIELDSKTATWILKVKR